MCQGLNSHYFHIIGDGHQSNSRGLYTHEIRIPSLKVGGLPSPTKRDNLDPGTYGYSANFTGESTAHDSQVKTAAQHPMA